jgi:hypothetical protein
MEITTTPLEQAALFCAVSFCTVIISYIKIWATETETVTLWQYLTGDKRAIARALVALLSLWAAAGGFDYLANLTDQEIIGAAIGLGMLVPQRADSMRVSEEALPVVEVTKEEFDDYQARMNTEKAGEAR